MCNKEIFVISSRSQCVIETKYKQKREIQKQKNHATIYTETTKKNKILIGEKFLWADCSEIFRINTIHVCIVVRCIKQALPIYLSFLKYC